MELMAPEGRAVTGVPGVGGGRTPQATTSSPGGIPEAESLSELSAATGTHQALPLTNSVRAAGQTTAHN